MVTSKMEMSERFFIRWVEIVHAIFVNNGICTRIIKAFLVPAELFQLEISMVEAILNK